MRSRKILVTAVIGLLLISVVAPVVAFGESECEPTGIEDCTWQDWLVWLAEYFIWIMSRPDGPPPVPSCLVE